MIQADTGEVKNLAVKLYQRAYLEYLILELHKSTVDSFIIRFRDK